MHNSIVRNSYNICCPFPVISCPRFSLRGEGSLIFSSKTIRVGTTVTATCYEGFTLRGPRVRWCTDAATWNGTLQICDGGGMYSFQPSHVSPQDRSSVAIGPATSCDDVHPRWDVPKLLRYIKTAWDVLRCIFQHVRIFAPNFGIAQPFTMRFSNGFQHCDDELMSFLVICEA